MKTILSALTLAVSSFVLAGCSVFGNPGVEIAPYTATQTDGTIEIRTYKEMVLATTPMEGGMRKGDNRAFFRLFDYISGENTGSTTIPMTAPVFMADADKSAIAAPASGEKIPMTAPVLMNDPEGSSNASPTMSFVLPATMTYDSAPRPTNPQVTLEKITDYTVAAIRFSGLLSYKNIANNRQKLESWITASGYTTTGEYVVAGYDPPYTLPMFRRNEILIPVKKK
jgi:hypothetical protein